MGRGRRQDAEEAKSCAELLCVCTDVGVLLYFSWAGLALTADPLMAALPPVSSCLSLSSTFSLPSNPMVTPSLSSSASTRMASAVLAASMRDTLPLSLGAAWPTSEAW